MLLLQSELIFEAEGSRKCFDFLKHSRCGCVTVEKTQEKGRLRVAVRSEKPCRLLRASLAFSYVFEKDTKIFLNGFQSATESVEHGINDKMIGLSHLSPHAVEKNCLSAGGDYEFVDYPQKAGVLHGFSYGYLREDKQYTLLGSVDERSGFTVLHTDVRRGTVTVEKDCEGFSFLGEYLIFDLCVFRGTEEQVFDAYFAAMKLPPLQEKRALGFSSRIELCKTFSAEEACKSLAAVKNGALVEKPQLFFIGQGYQRACGDWLTVDTKRFPNGMATLAKSIAEQGIAPGISLSPFVCAEHSTLFLEHPQWLLHDGSGQPIKAAMTKEGALYALDSQNEQVLAYLKDVFAVMKDVWGYQAFEVDHLYAACMLPRRNKTRGQIMCEAIDFLRACTEGRMLIAAKTPLAPAFGKVDYCKVCCDVTERWEGKPGKNFSCREKDSVVNALQNAVFRRQLNGRAFWNDTDVILLRKEHCALSPLQRTVFAKLSAVCGGLLLISDDVDRYSENEKNALTELLALCGTKVLSAGYYKQKLIVCCKRDEDSVFTITVPLSGR